MTEPPPTAGRRGAAAWFALLGAPLAWAVHIGARYPLVPVACEHGLMVLHAVTVGCLLASLAAIWTAVRIARAPMTDGVSVPVRRFMGRAGMVLGVLFTLVIVAEALPTAFQDPCL